MMNKFLNTKVLYIFISVIILIMFFSAGNESLLAEAADSGYCNSV